MSLFAVRLLDWYQKNGRHDLPWQKNKSLYSTWVSEIMLQQTQVATVIPYFAKFMQRFPDIGTLAQSSQDDVLLHWAGLGYYSRARNLHNAATIIATEYQGKFPEDYETVLALPGIGPSTAGAILAQVLNQHHAILDGNVKRVLARHRAIVGWPGQVKVAKQLWQLAKTYTPVKNVADYTQAIMDLGATICTRSSAKCHECPLNEDCAALETNQVKELPTRKPRKIIPVREKRLLIIRDSKGHYLMEKRPPTGIWGGLWSLPELAMGESVSDAVKQNWQLMVNDYSDLPVFRHTFSHFHLDITPCEVSVSLMAQAVSDDERFQWRADLSKLALAAPVSSIMQEAK